MPESSASGRSKDRGRSSVRSSAQSDCRRRRSPDEKRRPSISKDLPKKFSSDDQVDRSPAQTIDHPIKCLSSLYLLNLSGLTTVKHEFPLLICHNTACDLMYKEQLGDTEKAKTAEHKTKKKKAKLTPEQKAVIAYGTSRKIQPSGTGFCSVAVVLKDTNFRGLLKGVVRWKLAGSEKAPVPERFRKAERIEICIMVYEGDFTFTPHTLMTMFPDASLGVFNANLDQLARAGKQIGELTVGLVAAAKVVDTAVGNLNKATKNKKSSKKSSPVGIRVTKPSKSSKPSQASNQSTNKDASKKSKKGNAKYENKEKPKENKDDNTAKEKRYNAMDALGASKPEEMPVDEDSDEYESDYAVSEVEGKQ